MQAFSAMAIIPIVGPILGAAAAAAVGVLGGIMVSKIKAAPDELRYRHCLCSRQGSLIRAGEGGRSEAIIPLENPEAMSKLGGMGGTTYVFNIGNLYATDEMPEEVAEQIDRALFRLQLNKNSTFAEAVA